MTSLFGSSDDSGASDLVLTCLLELVERMSRWRRVGESRRDDRRLAKEEMGRSAFNGMESVGGSDRPGNVVSRTLMSGESMSDDVYFTVVRVEESEDVQRM